MHLLSLLRVLKKSRNNRVADIGENERTVNSVVFASLQVRKIRYNVRETKYQKQTKLRE